MQCNQICSVVEWTWIIKENHTNQQRTTTTWQLSVVTHGNTEITRSNIVLLKRRMIKYWWDYWRNKKLCTRTYMHVRTYLYCTTCFRCRQTKEVWLDPYCLSITPFSSLIYYNLEFFSWVPMMMIMMMICRKKPELTDNERRKIHEWMKPSSKLMGNFNKFQLSINFRAFTRLSISYACMQRKLLPMSYNSLFCTCASQLHFSHVPLEERNS